MSSSGGWEIVGKKYKDRSNGKATKLTKAEKKNFIMDSPKLEDFLPLNQVKSLYDRLDANKENKKPAKEKESKSRENEEKKKQEKLRQAEKMKKQSQTRAKEKSGKSARRGVAEGISADELNEILENDKMKFPDAPLIWLKDLVSYLDSKIPAETEDPNFQTKPDSYPLSLLSKSAKLILERTVAAAGRENARLCWEGTLATMIKNISNASPDIGCKIFLQLLAQTNPQMTMDNLPKLASLRNSYQNKKSIGLSLLWAFSQSGKKNLAVGLTVWHEIMAPMLESRTYASYVLKILNDLLAAAPDATNDMTSERFFDILDDLSLGKINIPTIVENDVSACMTNLRLKMTRSELISRPKIFQLLVSRLAPKSNARYRQEILKALLDCLRADSRCFSIWTNIYPKSLYQSDLLLKQLLADWNTPQNSDLRAKALKGALENFQTLGIVSKKGKEENLCLSCLRTSEALVEKMSASKKKERSSFPFRTGIVVLLVLIGAVVTYDCQRHGSFQASRTGIFLKSSGITRYGKGVLSTIAGYKDNGALYLEKNYPHHYKTANEITTKYLRLLRDLCLVGKNVGVRVYENLAKYAAEKKPLLAQNVEYYFPGLMQHLWEKSIVGIERVKAYSAMIGEEFSTRTVGLVGWMERNVFVGNLSPKNMRGYATRAVETTQNFAGRTYDWVYEKVQTLSKIH